jgi:H+/Cl- antiporter ClcA
LNRDDDEARDSERSVPRLPIAPSLGPVLETLSVPFERANVDKRVLALCGLTIGLGLAAAGIARILTAIIGLITNLAFHGRWSTAFASPAGNHLGLLVVVIPVVGGLVVGVMARYGSKAIRGHGIPEAMEQVLFNESRIPARVTFLKPLSAAVAIGTGGPFGAEGPIIATGGALGSFVGQVLRVSSEERKTLLAAGAAAGMAATFASPVSAVLLAVELLLFEYRLRSIVPVALASAAACGAHVAMVGSQPAFNMPTVASPSGSALAFYIALGVAAGVVSMLVTRAVYAVEDAFEKLPIHWVWWPAIGGVVVGVVGWFSPHTMGVGYDNIDRILGGDLTGRAVILFCSEIRLLVPVAGLGHVGRHARAAVHDRRGPRFGSRDSGRVGASLGGHRRARRRSRRNGRALRGRIPRAARFRRLRVRDDPSADGPPAAPGRVHDRVPRLGDAHAKLDHDREDRPARRARRQRLRGRLPRPAGRGGRRGGARRDRSGRRHDRARTRLDGDARRRLGAPGLPGGRRR